MREVRGKVGIVSQAKIFGLGLFLLLFASCISFSVVRAEDTSPAETTTQQSPETADPSVESPGVPVVTSSTEEYDIVWVWSPPASGTTPDAPAADPNDPNSPQDPASEQPTDIIQYGYEFSKDGVTITTGAVPADTTTVTTAVYEDGTYLLKVWSITRAAATSATVSGTVTISTVIPEVSTLPPIEIPDPIDTSSVSNNPLTGRNSGTDSGLAPSTDSTVRSPDFSRAAVLSASDTASETTPVAVIASAVKPSTQGWMIIGLPWYVWLLILAAVGATWRWVIVRRDMHL